MMLICVEVPTFDTGYVRIDLQRVSCLYFRYLESFFMHINVYDVNICDYEKSSRCGRNIRELDMCIMKVVR